jgi:hypothetical protein
MPMSRAAAGCDAGVRLAVGLKELIEGLHISSSLLTDG